MNDNKGMSESELKNEMVIDKSKTMLAELLTMIPVPHALLNLGEDLRHVASGFKKICSKQLEPASLCSPEEKTENIRTALFQYLDFLNEDTNNSLWDIKISDVLSERSDYFAMPLITYILSSSGIEDDLKLELLDKIYGHKALSGGANWDLNEVSVLGTHALIPALRYGSLEVAERVIELGARLEDVPHENEDARSWMEKTMLGAAMLTEKQSLEKLELLLGLGVNPNSPMGRSHMGSALNRAVYLGKFDHAKRLLEAGALVQYELGLIQFLDDDLSDLVKPLVKAGENIYDLHEDGRAALHYAAMGGSLAVMKELLDLGANINQVTEEGETALYFALSLGHNEVAKELLNRHASVHVSTKRGCTNLLMNISDECADRVENLVRRGLNVNEINEKGQTALRAAVQKDQYDIMQKLLDLGANVNMRKEDGLDAVADAIQRVSTHRSSDRALETLLRYSPDINLPQKDGNTCLHFLIKNNKMLDDFKKKQLRALTQHGIHLDAQNDKGSTALHMAVFLANLDMVTSLVHFGASLEIKDGLGKTALDIAKSIMCEGSASYSDQNAVYQALLAFDERKELEKITIGNADEARKPTSEEVKRNGHRI